MYRSENSYYPKDSGEAKIVLPTLVPAYMNSITTDHQDNQKYTYQYKGLVCDTSGCSDYTLESLLETSTTSCSPTPTEKCKETTACNYCLGPYGEK